MNLPDPQTAGSRAVVCPLCGAPVIASDERCRECNMTLAGVAGRPAPFTGRSAWRWGAALLVIYLVVLLVVIAVR